MTTGATASAHARADLDALFAAPSSAVADALDTLTRKPTVMAGIRLLSGQRIVGVAVTIMVAITGEKAHHNVGAAVLDESPEGTVVVAGGDPDAAALFGAPEISLARHRRLGGLVTDCHVRGLDAAGEAFGVAAAGVTSAGGFGRLKTMARDAKIQCGGVNLLSGDVVVGDGEGIVVVPAALVAATAAIAARHAMRIERLARAAEELGSLSDAVARHWNTA